VCKNSCKVRVKHARGGSSQRDVTEGKCVSETTRFTNPVRGKRSHRCLRKKRRPTPSTKTIKQMGLRVVFLKSQNSNAPVQSCNTQPLQFDVVEFKRVDVQRERERLETHTALPSKIPPGPRELYARKSAFPHHKVELQGLLPQIQGQNSCGVLKHREPLPFVPPL